MLITEDDPKTNPLIDWDFLNKCTIGFDKDHLPAGADPKENYKDYVLGGRQRQTGARPAQDAGMGRRNHRR